MRRAEPETGAARRWCRWWSAGSSPRRTRVSCSRPAWRGSTPPRTSRSPGSWPISWSWWPGGPGCPTSLPPVRSLRSLREPLVSEVGHPGLTVGGGETAEGWAAALGRRLRAGDRAAAPAALNLIEDRSHEGREAAAALLAEVSPAALGGEAPGHLVGITGPPGVGKSSLLSALVAKWRTAGRTVAILAVDPSSKRSGGSLLGDRTRIEHDPADDGILIRSTAAAGRLGGLAAPTRTAAHALASAFDVVVVETVGVGQSETEVEELCDTVAVTVQPGSGDTLQFLKAGIMEVPALLVVTKADLGDVARRAHRELEATLRSLGVAAQTPALMVS